MAKASGLSVEGKRVKQTVDLEELLGVDLSDSPFLVQSIGQEIVDYMRKRTSKSVDRNGKAFAAYSKSYKQSEDYEAAGKSSKVNMKLRGYMLNSLDFEANGSVIEFGFDDEEEELKAYGHMTGMKGHKHLDGKTPVREFFGMNDDDLVDLVERKFRDELEALKAPQEIETNLPSFDTQATAGTTTLDELFGDDDLFGGEF